MQSFLTRVLQRHESIVGDQELETSCARFVTGNARVTPAEQVDIYRRQYWLRHDDALLDDYPGLAHILGEDVWAELVRAYLAAHPPTFSSLRDLGHAMADFVEKWDGLPAGREAITRSMARYERAFVDVFDGAEPPPLSAERLGALAPEDWERARIVLSSLVVRMRLSHPVHLLRKAVRGGESPALPEARDVSVALFRKDLIVCFDELSADQSALLDALDAGASLVAACATVADGKTPEEGAALAADVGSWFRNWAASGFIADVVVP
ncbi:MAG: DUF2063 domain-containing protein [Polyangiaceae bacterium]|nr:DUF2063 domain-containing protein [Polyangiaceae bacterium]